MIPNEILNTFKVPRRYKIYAWSITLMIIVVGIYLSNLNNDWTILARSGALIVVLALSLESSGLIQKFINKIIKGLEEITPKIVEMQVKRNSNLYGNSGYRTDDEIKKISSKESTKRIESVQTLIEKTMYKDLRNTEFAIATIGTLLWGFEDLIGNYI